MHVKSLINSDTSNIENCIINLKGREEIAVEKEVNNLENLDIEKSKIKKKDKKPKMKKKANETSKSKTLDTNSLLKKKNDRNGIS